MEPDPKYYEWLKSHIDAMAHTESNPVAAESLRAIPDVITLLLGMLRDNAVPKRIQQTAASVLCYFILPTDLIPEAFVGIRGMKDDLFLAVLFLERIRQMGLAPVIEPHWKGAIPLFDCVAKILQSESEIVTPEIATTLRSALDRQFAD